MWTDYVFLLLPALLIILFALYWKIQKDRHQILAEIPTICFKCGRDLPEDVYESCPDCGASVFKDPNWTLIYHEPRTEKEMFWYGIMLLIFGWLLAVLVILNSGLKISLVDPMLLIPMFLMFWGIFLIAYTPVKSRETVASGKLLLGIFFLILAVIVIGLLTDAGRHTDLLESLLWFLLPTGSLLSLWGLADIIRTKHKNGKERGKG